MCSDPERERPTARANLKIVLEPFAEISAAAAVPESESRHLLDIARGAFNLAGPALTLWAGAQVEAPWWAAAGLAAGQLIVSGVDHWLDHRRTRRRKPNRALRRGP